MLLLPRERRTAGRSSAAIVLGFALLWPLSACEQAKVGRPEPASGPAKPPAPERQPPPDATAEAPEAGFVLPDGPIDGFHIDVPAACTNLQCQQTRCPGAPTSLSGTIYAPNGKLPLYNVIAYIPNAPLDPLPSGASCDRCGGKTSGHPIASAISNEEGKFRIENVPSGKDVPLVLQVGKWRRRVIIPEIVACQDNASPIRT
jgi:hypothetical protein